MEPRPCGRGNFMPILTRGWQFSCFNGATTLRSWKPPHHSPMVGLNAYGFNGATTLRSWKQPIPPCCRGLSSRASMEPRPCGRGNPAPPRAPNRPPKLQWSHDLAVVETFQPQRPSPRLGRASMEPRPCGRGNRRLSGRTPGMVRLQWSHDLAVVETWKLGPNWSIKLTSFNGATTLRSWKPRLLHPMAAAQSASMEPRPCGRGNALIAQGERIPARSFNGATTLRSWKLGINLTSGGRVQMLQWSHDLAVVETRNRRTRRRTG